MSTTRRVALLAVGASLVTLILKLGAYLLTDSVGLLSDAAESTVNLVAALMAFAAVSIADRPPDEEHTYGHDKIEYFSSGAEGTLILVAAITILYAALQRFLNPAPLDNLGLGTTIAFIAAVINFGVSRIMLRVAREHDSIALEADGQHLMTDVWTSIGLIGGLVLVGLTGWQWLDPLMGLAVGINIIYMGIKLVLRSYQGLMDTALPSGEIAVIQSAIVQIAGADAPYHGLRTRKSGARRFVDFHLLVPGRTLVQDAHDLAERIETKIQGQLAKTYVTIHVEPREDEASWDADRVGGIAIGNEKAPSFEGAREL